VYLLKMSDYEKTLTGTEKKALEIAKEHLQSSFSLVKSIGYINYLPKNGDK